MIARARDDALIAGTGLELGPPGKGQLTTLSVKEVVPIKATAPAGPEEQTLLFAHFGNGGTLTSDTILTNPSSDFTVTGTIQFLGDDGDPLEVGIVEPADGHLESDFGHSPTGPLAPMQFSVEPLGKIVISSDGLGEVVSGSVIIQADGDLGGVIRFDLPGFGIAGVGVSSAVLGFIVPVRREEAGINTGIAIYNVEDTTTTVDLSLRQNGVEVGIVTRELLPNGHLAEFIDQLFPTVDTAELVGTLVVIARDEARIAGTGLELGPFGAGQFTTLSVRELY